MTWVFPHRDLGEAPHPDGSLVLRPVVPLMLSSAAPQMLGVLDSGSPLSVADASIFEQLGIDLDSDDPQFEIGFTVGGRHQPIRLYEVTLWLHPPALGDEPVSWRLLLGARRQWKLPFAVLLGQRGWFDSFPTRIDAVTSTVEL